jgi:hypothetical protein
MFLVDLESSSEKDLERPESDAVLAMGESLSRSEKELERSDSNPEAVLESLSPDKDEGSELTVSGKIMVSCGLPAGAVTERGGVLSDGEE